MTKQVHIPACSGRLNESELAFLQLLGRSGRPAVYSVAQVGARIGVRAGTARRVIRSTGEKGYVEVHTRFQSNGGQLENEYLLTPSGQAVVDAWERQAVN